MVLADVNKRRMSDKSSERTYCVAFPVGRDGGRHFGIELEEEVYVVEV